MRVSQPGLSFIKSRHDEEPCSSQGVDKWVSRTLADSNSLSKQRRPPGPSPQTALECP